MKLKASTILLFMLFYLSAMAQTKGSPRSLSDELTAPLTISVTMALPMSGGMIPLTSPYQITIRGDSLYSSLPYYGRVYSYTPTRENGLNIQAPLLSYETKKGKKGDIHIKIKVRTANDLYKYHATIYDNYSAIIDVDMQNRQPIRFYGTLEEKAK